MKKNCIYFFLFLFSFPVFSQITTPPSGQNNKSIVTQYIGSIAHVTITYNSPDVTGPNGQSREGQIWGQLVPYGLSDLGFGLRNPSPWRAGANENTTIEFSHDILFQGQPIAAGKYGLHFIVEETGPWTIILSNNSSAWGSYFYEEKDDALRVQAIPESNTFHEWLTYEFVDRKQNSTNVEFRWENIKLPFSIEVSNANDLYVTEIKKELQTTPGFNWQSWVQAANFAIQNNTNLDDALVWADYAISGPFVGVENYQTLSTKAAVLNAQGKSQEASGIMLKAVNHATATSTQIHTFGRNLITAGQAEKAMEVFKLNHSRFDGAWPTNVGMMRGHSALGQYDEALKHAKIALRQAPDQLNKDNLSSLIEMLNNNQDIN